MGQRASGCGHAGASAVRRGSVGAALALAAAAAAAAALAEQRDEHAERDAQGVSGEVPGRGAAGAERPDVPVVTDLLGHASAGAAEHGQPEAEPAGAGGAKSQALCDAKDSEGAGSGHSAGHAVV